MAIEGRGPEKLIPSHLSAVETAEKKGRKAATQQTTAESTPTELQQGIDRRHEALGKAPNLEEILRAEWKEKNGSEAPNNRNLSLDEIGIFRIESGRAQSLRKAIKLSKTPDERARLISLYNQKRQEVVETYTKYGPSFEQAYREWMRDRLKFYEFLGKRRELVSLKRHMMQSAFPGVKEDKHFDALDRARIEAAAQTATTDDAQDVEEEALESLATVYGEGSKEYTEVAEQFHAHAAGTVAGNKDELRKEIERLTRDTQELWEENPMVRYFYGQKEKGDIIKAFAEGKDVVETQSVIRELNTLWQWEQEHTNTTVGGILVGEPGVGKTTLVRDYLGRLDRDFVYIDLSEDVTRYLLYGSKNIEFKNTREHHIHLIEDLGKMNTAELQQFVTANAAKIAETLHLKGDEATATSIGGLLNEFATMEKQKGELPIESKTRLANVKERLEGIAKDVLHKDIAYNLFTLVKKNGWRDGVIVSALRNNQSVILDEFNKNKNWSLIYGLITAKPGEKWYFADNDEWIDIPKNWRMYFTANIGKRHGVFEIPEALASRAEGKVMEIKHPPGYEEIWVAFATMVDSDADFVRSPEDVAKMAVLINEVFPKIRKNIKDKRQAIPVSYRTIRNLGEKLMRIRDPESGALVYQPTNKSFDEALYEVLVGTYALYEDKAIPKEIAGLCASAGLMLTPELKERMIALIGEPEYKKYDEAKQKNVKAYDEVLRIIQGMSTVGFYDSTALPQAMAAGS